MSGQPITINEDGSVTSVGRKPENESEKTYMNGRITVVERPNDYIAYLDGNTGMWERGKTVAEAVGKLVMLRLPR